MELLQAGVDGSVIALWLGHESMETTQVYLHAHIALKEAALAKLKPYEPMKRAILAARVMTSAYLHCCRLSQPIPKLSGESTPSDSLA
jgi:hypothetical protein